MKGYARAAEVGTGKRRVCKRQVWNTVYGILVCPMDGWMDGCVDGWIGWIMREESRLTPHFLDWSPGRLGTPFTKCIERVTLLKKSC